MENTPPANEDSSSLENPDTTASTPGGTPSPSTDAPPPAPTRKQKMGARLQGLIVHVNIYLLLLVLILVISAIVVVVGLQRNKRELGTPELTVQDLTQEALEQINDSEAKIGDPKQTLNIESNTIFAGKVLVRDSLDVAGTIRVGSAINLPGITVSGTSSFDQVQANRLSVSGDTSVQGALNVQRNISAAGGGSFGGPVSAPQLNVQSLQLSGDLGITRHIDAGGGTPGLSNGSALGGGGTASVSGSDTAGTVTINTGSSPAAGCFATVSFSNSFNATPHVVITPVGSAAAGLNYYVNRSSANFSICTTNAAPAGQNFAFDYIVID